jgi:[acyl-carrier-protein] S-malonyltransferase
MTDATLAFVYPGQGSQRPGMLAEAHERFPCVRETLNEASDVLGFDVWQLIREGDEEQLSLTETTQPLLLAASVALWRAWLSLGGARPAFFSGHSLGEFSALTCAGSLAFADAVSLVRRRGAAMQSAVPVGEGAMAAVIGLEDATIEAACRDVVASGAGVVEPVNYNAPGQVVIAGHRAALEAAGEALRAAGARRVLSLPVSAPFHTSLMTPAGDQLAAALAEVEVNAPAIPVLHNVNAETESDPARIRELLIRQLSSPVRWTDCVRAMAARGVRCIAECGPGRVLGGLNRRIDRSLESVYLERPEAMEALRTAPAVIEETP